MKKLIALLILVAPLALTGCSVVDSIVGRKPCKPVISYSAVAGFPGLYRCETDKAGPATWTVNAVSTGDPQGLLFAVKGDIVSACVEGCGCSDAIELR